MNFYFDGEVVGRNETHDDGWDWVDDSHEQVEFYGAHCRALQAHEVDSIDAKFGCSTEVW